MIRAHPLSTTVTAIAAGAAALLLATANALPRPSGGAVDFNRDVAPILSQNCFLCHGLDTNKRYGGLRLDRPDIATRKLASGNTAIVPGSLAESEMIQRITASGATRMPPENSGKRLTAQQIETLKRWVAQGAHYAPHWSYAPVTGPALPPLAGRPAWEQAWAHDPIDRFLLTRMEKAGLKPTPPAPRETLIRRLSLDLTGLPPTPKEVAAFVSDRNPNAYEKLVDRYLASPHFGERMAQYWLDLVRYADTVGYHGDQDVTVWPYRDYVIRAFNSDKPFDVFTREQIAGDLLPNATAEQKVASGYYRLGEMSAEGGVQDKEYRAKYAAERVRNLSLVWLGSTMACCECHDHKYDPFTTRDFYSMEAFFADLKERGFYDTGYSLGDWGPSIRLPSAAQKARLEDLDGRIADAKKALTAVTDAQLAAGMAKWEVAVREQDAAKGLGWTVVKPDSAVSSEGSTLQVRPDSTVLATGKLPPFDTYTVTVPAARDRIAAIKLDAVGDDSLPGNGTARAGWYFVLSGLDVSVQRGSAAPQPVKLSSVQVGGEDEGYPGYAMLDDRRDTGWATVWAHAYDQRAVFRLAEPLQGGPDTKLVIRIHQDAEPHHLLGRFRLSLSGVEEPDLSAQGIPDKVLAAIWKDAAKRTADETRSIAEYYRRVAPETREQREALARLEGEGSILLGEIPHTLITEATEPRTIRILPRGNWMDDSGPVVQPAVPHFLRQIDKPGRATRLDLANWLVSPDNPLTARVFVNRMWKLFFGTGIAKNLDDFGAQGEPPVNPELLDWLAAEFMSPRVQGSPEGACTRSAPPSDQWRERAPRFRVRASELTTHDSQLATPVPWDVKHIVRLVVLSNAYRQSSDASPEAVAKDPLNRLCARQPPIRLDAEFVRDVALKVSGLLSSTVGGPSVKPYEPKGYLAPLNFPRREWAADTGEKLYRRGLYTFWQRTFLHPSLLAFDAPTREEGTCTRAVSNTPMQALVLLNDPIYVEASRVFAERILREGGSRFDRRLDFAYEAALSRAPESQETTILRDLYRSQRARYAADPAAARQLILTGEKAVPKDLDPVELAAWTSVARAILNLHETITRS